jgi:T5SS/PEP-CTERM-associated repeat protein
MTHQIALLAAIIAVSVSTAFGAITPSGDVSPANPSDWTDTTSAYVGYYDAGAVIADGEAALLDRYLYLGFQLGSSGMARLSGIESTWTNTGTVFAGYFGRATLEITDGAQFSNNVAYLAHMQGSTASVTVSEDHTTWTNSNTLHVGHYGHAALEITNGASVSDTFGLIAVQSGSRGIAEVSGAGSMWTNSSRLHVGELGYGTLKIRDGGTVECPSGHIGEAPGAIGAAEVSGAGSRWTNSSSILIGVSGRGELTVTDGGSINSDGSATIGFSNGSYGKVALSGAGTTWTNATALAIGSSGAGVMEVSDGARVSCGNGNIATLNNAKGLVTVTGAGSAWTSRGPFFYVGNSGQGEMRVADGGLVSSSTARVGMWAGSSGTVTVSDIGARWTNSNDLYVGYKGAATLGIHYGGLVSVYDDLTIDKDDNGDSYITMGSGGMLAIKGRGYDSLADFIDLIDTGDDIRYWNESTLSWANISGATPGDDYTLGYILSGELLGYSVLTVHPPTPLGDSDRNGMVDDLDYNNLIAQFGGAPGDESADFNGDGRVDLADFSILRRYYGHGVVDPAAAPGLPTVIPEPATLAILGGGLGLVLKRRRKAPRRE